MSTQQSLTDLLDQLITNLRELRKKILKAASVDLMLTAIKGTLTNFQPKVTPWQFVFHMDKTRILSLPAAGGRQLQYYHTRPTHYLGDETQAVLKEFPTISRPDVNAIKTVIQSYTQQAESTYLSRHRSLTGYICVGESCNAIELIYYGTVEFDETFSSEQIVYILDDANYPATPPVTIRIRGLQYLYDDGVHKIQLVLADEASYYSSTADVWVRSSGLYAKLQCQEDFHLGYSRSLYFCTTGYTWVFVETTDWSLEARL